ncbi:hypothetical protein COOONC_01191 [Cooperia oncophora]
MRTQCRSCRFQKCLEAGMKPEACRPNRDYTGRQKKKALAMPKESGDTNMDASHLYPLRVNTLREIIDDPSKLKGKRSEMRYEPFRLAKNDELSSVAYRRLIAAIDWVEHLASLMGGLSVDDKMRYEPFRLAKNDELSSVAYRRLIAAIDWVEHLASLMGGLSVDDKIALVKNAFAPLMVFKFASRTAEVAKDENILCLCNFAYVPRNISQAFSDS